MLVVDIFGDWVGADLHEVTEVSILIILKWVVPIYGIKENKFNSIRIDESDSLVGRLSTMRETDARSVSDSTSWIAGKSKWCLALIDRIVRILALFGSILIMVERTLALIERMLAMIERMLALIERILALIRGILALVRAH
jgi:hypothetical protein